MSVATPEQFLLSDSFVDSPTFSDIELCFGNEHIKAHKVILSQNSPWFKRAFTSNLKAEVTGELHLNGDDPQAVKGAMAWLYDLKFDGKEYVNKRGFFYRCRGFLFGAEGQTRVPSEAAEYAKYLVGLFVAATKYEIDTLPDQAKQRLHSALDGTTNFYAGLTHADDVARHVYLNHHDAAIDLRPLITQLFIKDLGRFDEMPRFHKMLLDVPELAADIVRALAGKAKASTVTAAAPDNLLKRKSANAGGPGQRSAKPPSTTSAIRQPVQINGASECRAAGDASRCSSMHANCWICILDWVVFADSSLRGRKVEDGEEVMRNPEMDVLAQ